MDALASIARDSALFLDAVRAARPDARVPACPEWGAADLTYHLAEVQDFWSAVVGPAEGRGLDGGAVRPLPRPADDAALPTLLAEATARLLTALEGRDPHEPCWSWHDEGRTVGWASRRQAHEVLVHRVDAEQTAGRDVTSADPEVAADGVDEILRVLVDRIPAWATFTPDGSTVSVAVDGPGETPRSWSSRSGASRGQGPSPASRTTSTRRGSLTCRGRRPRRSRERPGTSTCGSGDAVSETG